jgi:hypothetical protein
VVDGIVAHLALNSGWTDDIRERGEKAVQRCAVTDGLHAWDICAGCFSRGKQRSDPVQKTFVPAVHQEAEMRKEVHTDDGIRDIGHHEPLREISA